MKIALAPMAGITDSAFRLMNKFGGADLVYSEMAHVNAISYNSKKTLGMLKASPFEFPYVVQLFGKDPKYFAKAAKIISTQGVPLMNYKPFENRQMRFVNNLAKKVVSLSFHNFYHTFLEFQEQHKTARNISDSENHIRPSGLDINLGCPAKKVFGHGGGAALWKDLDNLRAVLDAVLDNTDLPVSIKVRTAVGEVKLFDLLDKIKDLPLKRVMTHGRTFTQGFSGPADAKLIREAIKKYPQFEFWANGGIVDRKSALDIVEEAECQNLGIARGTYGNPLLAEEIKSDIEELDVRSLVNKSCILAYVHSLLAYQSKDERGIVEMRKHLAWYFKDFPDAKDWRKQLVQVKNIQEIEEILEKIVKETN